MMQKGNTTKINRVVARKNLANFVKNIWELIKNPRTRIHVVKDKKNIIL